ncbi:hypothetical protein ACLEPN_43245, partial [Myxococcus sp. 1LA]
MARQDKASRLAKARAHSEAGHATGLHPEELCSRTTYAVEQDFAPALARLRGLAKRHRAELEQWQAADGVSPTLGALVALLRYLQGLAPRQRYQPGDRRKLCGLGVQVPLRWLAAVLGRDKSTVCDALQEGQARGLLLRYAPLRRVAAVTAQRSPDRRKATVVTRDGIERKRINVHGILYLTPQGAAWCDRRGTTVDDLGRRNARLRGQRGRVVTGILADVLDALRSVRQAIAARFAASATDPTPDDRAQPGESNSGVGRAVDNPAGSHQRKGAVWPAATEDRIRSRNAQDAAKAPGPASAPPDGVSRVPGPSGALQTPSATHAGLSGAGTFSPGCAKTPGRGYGPPLRPGDYLDGETERCWRRHVQVEGGPPRRALRKVYGIGGEWLGDMREELEPGLVWRWAPALTAAEAYPGEWRAARGLAPVRAQLEADFAMYLGPRLRRRFLARETARAGETLGCPWRLQLPG